MKRLIVAAAIAIASIVRGESRECWADWNSMPSNAVDYVTWLFYQGDSSHAPFVSKWLTYDVKYGRFWIENTYDNYIEVRDKNGYGLAGAWIPQGTDFTNIVFDAALPAVIEKRLRAWMPKAKKRQGTVVVIQ